jgi:hypothetical protein
MSTPKANKPAPHYTQKSEEGNDELISGLPIRSDGSYRPQSDLNDKKNQPARG